MTYSLTSTILKSDLFLLLPHSTVETLWDRVIVRSNFLPEFYWGNYIIIKDISLFNSAADYVAAFRAAFNDVPAIRHIAITWDLNCAPDTQINREFEMSGFNTDVTNGLIFEGQLGAKPNYAENEIVAIESDKDWVQVQNLQVQMLGYDASTEDKHMLQARLKNFRKFVEQGQGIWLGLFLEHQLVADLGVFFEGNIARFQHVETHPNYRKRGFCSALIRKAMHLVRAKRPNDNITFVLEAEAESDACRLYKSLGFEQKEVLFSVEKSAL